MDVIHRDEEGETCLVCGITSGRPIFERGAGHRPRDITVLQQQLYSIPVVQRETKPPADMKSF